jgi:hypothetical protein
VVDLSSYEEDFFPETSWDEDFARRLFGDLNCDLLGPPDDDKVIILSDSDDEEEEVREEDATNTEAAPSSVVKSPISTAFNADADEAPKVVQGDSNGGHTLNQEIGSSSTGRDKVSSP